MEDKEQCRSVSTFLRLSLCQGSVDRRVETYLVEMSGFL